MPSLGVIFGPNNHFQEFLGALRKLKCAMRTFLLLIFFFFSCFFTFDSGGAWALESDVEFVDLPFNSLLGPSEPSGSISEVAPPIAAQKIFDSLSNHQPRLKLVSPANESILSNNPWELVIDLEDWPLVNDPQLGLGPHVVVQVDDRLPIRISAFSGEKLHIPMKPLSPGSHRFAAYAALPWGEAIKDPGASLQWRLHSIKKLKGTQPEEGQPWMTIANPSDLNQSEPLLLDWLLWNSPLQNISEGDDQWRMRISINDDSFLMDHPEAIWIDGLLPGQNIIQFEVIDSSGESINPFFNKQLKIINLESNEEQPPWMNSNISEKLLSRYTVERELFDEINNDEFSETLIEADFSGEEDVSSEDIKEFQEDFDMINSYSQMQEKLLGNKSKKSEESTSEENFDDSNNPLQNKDLASSSDFKPKRFRTSFIKGLNPKNLLTNH